jgi:hypothetical protein
MDDGFFDGWMLGINPDLAVVFLSEHEHQCVAKGKLQTKKRRTRKCTAFLLSRISLFTCLQQQPCRHA